MGASLVLVSAADHDRVLAKTSHLPHLLAYAYMSLLDKSEFNLAGGGLEDFTRISESNPDMWWEIFQLNREELLEALRTFSMVIDKFDRALSEVTRDSVIDLMVSSSEKRKNL